MTTTNEILIGGFNFKWIEIGAMRERSDLNELKNRFGVYIFVEETGVSYVGLCGRDPGQKQDLRERIGQYFSEKDTGATFAKNWIAKNDLPHKCFMKYLEECNLVTISTEEADEDRQQQLFGKAGIIGAVETFLICDLTPLYNVICYRMTNNEKNNIRAGVNARL